MMDAGDESILRKRIRDAISPRRDQQMNAEAEIQTVLDLYVAGANGDLPKLREAFHPDATMTGRIGSGRDDLTPIADFIAMVERNPGLAGPDYTSETRSIDVTSDVGVAVLAETDYFGCDFVDYFTFVRLDDRWRITSKSYAHIGGSPSREIH